MNSSDLQKKHLAALREKYQVGQHKGAEFNGFLYLILRKAELSIQITDLEFQWLTDNRLFKTIETISLQRYQAEDFKRLEVESLNLRPKYKIPKELELPITSPVYSILWKLESRVFPTDSEFEILNSHNLVATTNLIREILNFAALKISYKATKYPDHYPGEPLYSILKKLDAREALSDFDANWLLDHDFEETLKIHWQQEHDREAIIEFLDLKAKYHIDSFPDTSISSPLYGILKKIKEKQDLENGECKWLEQQKLTQFIAIDRKRKDIPLLSL